MAAIASAEQTRVIHVGTFGPVCPILEAKAMRSEPHRGRSLCDGPTDKLILSRLELKLDQKKKKQYWCANKRKNHSNTTRE